MKSPRAKLAALFLGGALALVLAACEDSGLTAPTDGQIVLTANPATVVLDPDQGASSGQSTITATVFDSEGRPVQGVTVLFAVSGGGGTLEPTSGKTDPSGKVQTVLTLAVGDPAGSQVTAQSSSLSVDVQIEKIVLDANKLPTAGVVVSPDKVQLVNRNVLFDGSISSDPDGVITCFQWSINSDDDNFDEIVQGTATSAIERTFPTPQFMDVVLRVSDDPTLAAQCMAGMPAIDQNLFSPNIGVIERYEISCDNPPPVANAGPDKREVVGRGVYLDGTNSFDNETPIDSYSWDCGNGSKPIPDPLVPNGAAVTCVYFAAGTYTAELTVTDRGDGTIDPNTGRYRCQKSATDQAVVEIFVPTTP